MLRKRKGSISAPPNSSGNAEGSAGSSITKGDRTVDAAQEKKISKGKQLFNSVTRRSRLDFELYFFVFLTIHMLIQNFNIYRLNIYNYNVYLLLFCGLVYSRRLLSVLLGPKMFKNYPNLRGVTPFGSIVIFTTLVYVTFLLIKLYLFNSLKNVLLAVLPLTIIDGLDVLLRIYNRNIVSPSIEGVMLMQVKYIVCDTFQATYYTTVLPLRFLQSEYVFYDSARCIIVIFMVSLNAMWLLIEGFLFACFHDVYQYYSAQSVKKINTNLTPSADGKLMNIRGILFGTCNYYPDDENLTPWYWAVQYAILNPEKVHTFLIGTELTVIIFQLLLLINSQHWLIYGVMLLLNYSILLLCIYTRRRNIFVKRQFPMNLPTAEVRPIN